MVAKFVSAIQWEALQKPAARWFDLSFIPIHKFNNQPACQKCYKSLPESPLASPC
ncbi:hypothetical protein K493DRAFT_226358 [Basidiobolus meristosporus CBS 931.73]|uniref:Uncharacterized protein n=1 Tax=Basidiobolus meristosporus CBS 931.73 TaxID=1314790 RepID=A0A1Y1Y2H0_9FUNG|nr:hypothetical protein K493DRAFT_226358 [Basidiobolus meristosporus CBS 931.73]|eukprot:ORX92169.1 hypothetical protein K493DRAFT_226358 [Basidiobolus meristosporus CBS 931.73]